MTQADLDAKAARQISHLSAWVAACVRVINAKVDDAKAHAANAVTKSARMTPEGRTQLIKVRRHPSAVAAVARLGELTDTLAGRSIHSNQGDLREAREAFYRVAFHEWKGIISPRLWRTSDPEPTQTDLAYFRGLPLHGHDARTVVAGRIATAQRSLLAAIARTANRLSAEADKATINDAFLNSWEQQTKSSLLSSVKLLLSDSQIAADRLAGRDLVHSDYLDKTPLEIA